MNDFRGLNRLLISLHSLTHIREVKVSGQKLIINALLTIYNFSIAALMRVQ